MTTEEDKHPEVAEPRTEAGQDALYTIDMIGEAYNIDIGYKDWKKRILAIEREARAQGIDMASLPDELRVAAAHPSGVKDSEAGPEGPSDDPWIAAYDRGFSDGRIVGRGEATRRLRPLAAHPEGPSVEALREYLTTHIGHHLTTTTGHPDGEPPLIYCEDCLPDEGAHDLGLFLARLAGVEGSSVPDLPQQPGAER